jgi:hypothetical protein
LREAQNNINAEKYPGNFANLVSEFERRGLTPPEPENAQEAEPDYSDHMYSEQARLPIRARLTGLATFAFGVAWFMLRYEDGVLYGRRGMEYTFGDDPILFSFFILIHATVVVIGLLGLIFGSQFYRDLIKGQSSPSPFKRKN